MDLTWAEVMPIAGGELVNDELVQDGLHVLEVGHVAARAKHGAVPDRVQALYVLEARKRAIGRWRGRIQGVPVQGGSGRGAPRLSAAIIIPSLYLIASTLVPVTIGCLHHLV